MSIKSPSSELYVFLCPSWVLVPTSVQQLHIQQDVVPLILGKKLQ